MAELYSFGRFVLDPTERRLYADDIPVPLGATDIRLLGVLVENAGSLVPKADLVSRVWGRAAVTDNALYVHINALRKILGDDCIANKQGRGYRFIAQIQRTRKKATHPSDKPQTGNLPSLRIGCAADQISRLIGRTKELHVVSKLLARSRLVTLRGPGGVGKTKFALHAASKSTTLFPDGVWLVELGSLSNSDLAPTALASVLGLKIGARAAPLDTLARHLARRTLLIVLDNCEHVIGAAANLSQAILTNAPGVRILATSREALGCSGEHVFEIPALALPRGDAKSPEAIRATAAIELFVERAMSADSNFRLTDKDARVAARICRQVDGLPLAIEMIAGWAPVLGLEKLETKLNRSIDWVRAKNTVPQRHSTLRATLEWSHALLSAAEQLVLSRLALFTGNFSIEAAEAVVGDNTIPQEQVVEHIAGLIRKSMIAVVPGSQVQRYRLLETTRAFMIEKLGSSDDAGPARRKHALYVLGTLENAIAEWETTSDAVWQDRYGPIIDDLRTALDWAMSQDSDDAVALAGASWPLWRELSLRPEGANRLSAAATRLRSQTPPELEARLRRGLGDMLVNTAAMTAAHEEIDCAVSLYRTLGDATRLGSALTALGYTLLVLDRIDEAERSILEALNLLEAAGCPRTLATAYSIQLCIEATLGRFDAARAAGEKAARLSEMAGADRTGLVVAANLVQLTFESGDIDSAISAGRSVMRRLYDTPHSELRGGVMGFLAAALTSRGELDEALTAACQAAPILRDDDRLFWLFDHLALRAALAGRVSDAALISGYAEDVHQRLGRTREPMGRRAIERLTALLRNAMPSKEIAQLSRLGASLSEDQAMTLALRV